MAGGARANAETGSYPLICLAVIPGRCEASNPNVQMRIGKSGDPRFALARAGGLPETFLVEYEGVLLR